MMAPETVVTVDHNKPASPQAPPQQQNGALDWIKMNVEYFKTPPGILKIIQLVLGILCMALGTPWASTWFVFVAVTAFITTLLWSFVYFLSIREALKLPINWVLSELISTGVETLFYFIAFIVMFTSVYGNYGRNVAAAVFGIFNTLAYAASSYLLYQEHRSGSSTAAGAA
ncbi:CKLF-like MARVEL transmembrane domain-containing protein 4 isoform X2 [Bicyclus anynana]|uniref:CKLF-like MARVEL transmembrane domain-containing protein 4 isoform X2 n=1 Tax=Bicyclus anynana TaxID=110368 RepID=A0A6J1NNL3_BICAN|nr:CKLF-like MARVEL transmembrane domain-containing protein 4 isoform X2 [Bicyclus anynana]